MNTVHSSNKAFEGLHAIGRALMSIGDAGKPDAGPDAVDAARIAFDGHLTDARTAFGEMFAELIQTHPITTERQKNEAAARVPEPMTHDEAKHLSFLGIPID